MEPVKAVGVTERVNTVIVYRDKTNLFYEGLKGLVGLFCDRHKVNVLSEIKIDNSIEKANLREQTIFKVNSPPFERKEFKSL